MLVLSRKESEAIQVGGGITIKVLEVRGGRVRLGIDAPKSVSIQRSEVPARQTPRSPVRSALPSRSQTTSTPLPGPVASG